MGGFFSASDRAVTVNRSVIKKNVTLTDLFVYCILHEEDLCTAHLKMNHMRDAVFKTERAVSIGVFLITVN
jgi:hypothetical protein